MVKTLKTVDVSRVGISFFDVLLPTPINYLNSQSIFFELKCPCVNDAQSLSLRIFLPFEGDQLELPELDRLIGARGHETSLVRHHVDRPKRGEFK